MGAAFASVWSTILVAFGLGVVIALHEAGHFTGLKAAHAAVRQFALGMGPKIWSFWYGSTEYSLHLIPMGGFVRAVGESADGTISLSMKEDIAKAPTAEARAYLSDPKNWVSNKTPAQRLVYIVLGPIFSILGAMPLMMLTLAISGETVPTSPAQVDVVEKSSPAEKAGILPGDKVVAVDGVAVSDGLYARIELVHSEGETAITVLRGEEALILKGTPEKKNGRSYYGVGFGLENRSYSPGEAVVRGVKRTFEIIAMQFIGVTGLVTGSFSVRDFSGPVGVITHIGKSAQSGFGDYVGFLAMLSIGIGAINLIPILPLDGGHTVLTVAELVRKRPLPDTIVTGYAFSGVALVAVFAVLTLYFDVAKLFG